MGVRRNSTSFCLAVLVFVFLAVSGKTRWVPRILEHLRFSPVHLSVCESMTSILSSEWVEWDWGGWIKEKIWRGSPTRSLSDELP
ncbi:hypothetical protein BJX66DRAFT_211314 [Aspergillus keveii]|uniref:Secreted protein n=1 Tax=Aspergillus keveii TaxID=714993 RepID=A0ABR4GM41_9EURO